MRFQVVEYPFVGGVDQKTDGLQLKPPDLTTLINGVRRKTGAIEKRRGFGLLSSTIRGAGTLATARKVLSYYGQTLVTDGNSLYAHTIKQGTAGVLVNQDLLPGCIGTKDVVAQTSVNIFDPDIAQVGAYTCVAWFSPTDGVRLTVKETATGVALISALKLDIAVSGSKPKCIALGSTLIVLYDDVGTGQVFGVSLNLSTPNNAVSASTLLVTNGRVASGWAWDAVANIGSPSTTFTIAYEAALGTNRITLQRWNASFVSQATGTVAETGNPFDTIGIRANAGDTLWISYSKATNPAIFVATHNADTLAQITAPFSIPHPEQALAIGIEDMGTDGGGARVALLSIVVSNIGTRLIIVTKTGGTVYQRQTQNNLYAISRPFLHADGHAYVVAYNGSSVINGVVNQQTQFLLDCGTLAQLELNTIDAWWTRHVCVHEPRIQVETQLIRQASSLSSVATITAAPAGIANAIKYAYAGFIVVTRGKVGVAVLGFDFGHPSLWMTADAGALAMSAGAPSQYDGNIVTELSYAHWPEQGILSPSASGGAMATGTYQYAFVFAWQDSSGYIHRSAPSVPQSVSVTGPTGSVALTLLTLKTTARQKYANSKRPYVLIEVYRTKAGPGSVYYRVGTVNNDPTVNTVAFTDTLADATIASNLILYTNGGVLENDCPPSLASMVRHKDRLWGIGPDARTLWYTRYLTPGEGPVFNDVLTFMLGEGPGLTAIRPLGDNLILFESDRILMLVGDGPNDLGQGSDLSVQRLLSDVGCIEPRSIVDTPEGIIFRSRLGMMLLGRDLQVYWIGKEVVDELVTYPEMTGAVRLEDQHCCVFSVMTSAHTVGELLVYDYFHKKWHVWQVQGVDGTYPAGVIGSAAVQVPGALAPTYTIAFPTGGLFQQQADGVDYSDNGAWVTMTIETAWITLDALEGYKRIRRIEVLTQQYTNHQFKIEIAWDYNTASYPYNHLWTDANINAFATNKPQFEVLLPVSKVESVRVRLTDAPPAGALSTSRGCAVTALAFQVGVPPKLGAYPLPAAQRG